MKANNTRLCPVCNKRCTKEEMCFKCMEKSPFREIGIQMKSLIGVHNQ